MTERDWSKADLRLPDPATVTSVSDTGGVFCGNDARPFVPKSVQIAKRAAAAKRKREKKRKKAATAAARGAE